MTAQPFPPFRIRIRARMARRSSRAALAASACVTMMRSSSSNRAASSSVILRTYREVLLDARFTDSHTASHKVRRLVHRHPGALPMSAILEVRPS